MEVREFHVACVVANIIVSAVIFPRPMSCRERVLVVVVAWVFRIWFPPFCRLWQGSLSWYFTLRGVCRTNPTNHIAVPHDFGQELSFLYVNRLNTLYHTWWILANYGVITLLFGFFTTYCLFITLLFGQYFPLINPRIVLTSFISFIILKVAKFEFLVAFFICETVWIIISAWNLVVIPIIYDY